MWIFNNHVVIPYPLAGTSITYTSEATLAVWGEKSAKYSGRERPSSALGIKLTTINVILRFYTDILIYPGPSDHVTRFSIRNMLWSNV